MYQTTASQFTFYKNFSIKAFEFIKAYIVKSRVQSVLEVQYCDYIRNFFGTNRFPNIVTIFMDNIVHACGNVYNKNAIFSLIIEVITHELVHKEIVFSQQLYMSDKIYKMRLEDTVNYYAFDLLKRNRKYINQELGIDLDLKYLEQLITGYDTSTSVEFKRATNSELWLYSIIRNVILRNDKNFKDLKEDVLDPSINLAIWFNDRDNFIIKRNGVYCDDELARFAQYSGDNIAQYDRYKVDIEGGLTYYRGIENIYLLVFKISKQGMYPMIFGDGIYE